ncbi:TPA: hypothetical protein ACH6NP_001321, partial [Enterococcus faecium]
FYKSTKICTFKALDSFNVRVLSETKILYHQQAFTFILNDGILELTKNLDNGFEEALADGRCNKTRSAFFIRINS